MTSSIISIGRSGAAAARAAIELSAQNIANANNPNYSRRSLELSEFVSFATIDNQPRGSFSGVEIGGVRRPGTELAQRAVRDSAGDLQRADAELNGLRGAELALEQSRIYEGLVNFEASLTLLTSDPTDPALRTGAIESARQLAQRFQFADASLDDVNTLIEGEIAVGVDKINGAAAEIARINIDLAKARDGTAVKASLLDARDAALRDLAEEFGVVATFDDKGVAEVRLVSDPLPPGESGVLLVSGGNFGALSASLPGDGTVSFSLGGASFSPLSGAMAGRSAALSSVASQRSLLDDIANQTITRANTAQAAGVALNGSPGQPLFSGSGAAGITLALNDGAGLALAAAGSPAGSRDTANLANLIAAFGADDGPIAGTDRLLLDLSSRIAGLNTTREGLSIINQSAEAELLSETGVDLDAEAAALIRLQQAFEANGRVIQVANDLFDTILGLS